jgi:RNA-binding protein
MQIVGEMLHKARSGRLIIRLFKKVEPGSKLFDAKGKMLAKVVELIGPVTRPYASALPAPKASDREGQKVYG